MNTRDEVLGEIVRRLGRGMHPENIEAVLSEMNYALVPVHTEPFRSLVGARALRDSMGDENFASRARSCWAAMLVAEDKP